MTTKTLALVFLLAVILTPAPTQSVHEVERETITRTPHGSDRVSTRTRVEDNGGTLGAIGRGLQNAAPHIERTVTTIHTNRTQERIAGIYAGAQVETAEIYAEAQKHDSDNRVREVETWAGRDVKVAEIEACRAATLESIQRGWPSPQCATGTTSMSMTNNPPYTRVEVRLTQQQVQQRDAAGPGRTYRSN